METILMICAIPASLALTVVGVWAAAICDRPDPEVVRFGYGRLKED